MTPPSPRERERAPSGPPGNPLAQFPLRPEERPGAWGILDIMARSIWTGAISFGLVTVPVKLYSSVNRKTVRFHQLSGKSGVRIAQKRVDPSTGDEVAYDEIVKGFELTPDRYVVIEPGELETLQPKKTKTIEIEDFVELSDIDPIYYDHPYYLAPGTGGAKPYRLLVDAMRETDRVAIARVVIRSKEALVAVRPMGDHVLGMSTMLFPDEVVDPDSIDEISATAEVDVTKRELDIAKQLVESLAGPFDSSKYHDTYRQEVLDLIERKAAGEEIAVQPAVDEDEEPVPDLMAALKASLDAVRDKDADAGNGAGKAKKAPAKAKAKPATARKKAQSKS
jgi:DNA end-binding protein Ku